MTPSAPTPRATMGATATRTLDGGFEWEIAAI